MTELACSKMSTTHRGDAEGRRNSRGRVRSAARTKVRAISNWNSNPELELPPVPVLSADTLAALAEQLDTNPAFAVAMDRAESDIIQAWRESAPGEGELREHHWAVLQALAKIRTGVNRMRMRAMSSRQRAERLQQVS